MRTWKWKLSVFTVQQVFNRKINLRHIKQTNIFSNFSHNFFFDISNVGRYANHNIKNKLKAGKQKHFERKIVERKAFKWSIRAGEKNKFAACGQQQCHCSRYSHGSTTKAPTAITTMTHSHWHVPVWAPIMNTRRKTSLLHLIPAWLRFCSLQSAILII